MAYCDLSPSGRPRLTIANLEEHYYTHEAVTVYIITRYIQFFSSLLLTSLVTV
jgi:hypothetical protein